MSIQQTNIPGALPAKKPVAPLVVSIIALAMSVIACISSGLVPLLGLWGFTGSVHLTTEAAIAIFGIIAFGMFGCVLGPAGAIMGIVSAMVSIVMKRFTFIWMSILSVILGIVAPLIIVAVYYSATGG
jgi:hypothetical protein